MKQLFISLILVTLVSACTVRGPDPDPKVSQAPGRITFGPLAAMDEKQYLFEQHALFRKKFNNRGVESKINGDTLELTISGNITFSINSAKLNWNVHEILDRIVPVFKEYENTSILVLGHSDARGDKVINQRISEQRARVIRDYFIRSGIEPQRIVSIGMGDEDLLIIDDITTVDRALNRRITIEITVNNVAQGTPDNSVNEDQ